MLAGVSVTLNGITVTSSSDGSYIFNDVSTNVNSAGVSTLSGYTFEPPFVSVSNLSANKKYVSFTGTARAFEVSGRITLGGASLPGVSVAFNGQTATTNSLGYYVFANVPFSANGAIVPSLSGYIFTPASRPVNGLSADLLDGDFTATRVYTVSGTITSSGNYLPGVTVSFDNKTTTTNEQGVYEFKDISAGLSGLVVPSRSGFTFTPTNDAVTNLARIRLPTLPRPSTGRDSARRWPLHHPGPAGRRVYFHFRPVQLHFHPSKRRGDLPSQHHKRAP
jgi:hypothetical protein